MFTNTISSYSQTHIQLMHILKTNTHEQHTHTKTHVHRTLIHTKNLNKQT